MVTTSIRSSLAAQRKVLIALKQAALLLTVSADDSVCSAAADYVKEFEGRLALLKKPHKK
jgi:hypothetical protein